MELSIMSLTLLTYFIQQVNACNSPCSRDEVLA